MSIDVKVIVLAIAHQIDVKQASAIEIEWMHKPRLFLLDIGNVLNSKRPRLFCHVNRLNRLAVLIHFDAGKQGGMSLECRLDGSQQAFAIKRTVDNMDKW